MRVVIYIALMCSIISFKAVGHPFFPTNPAIRKSSYPFISGDTFRLFCDHIFDETDVHFDPLAVKSGDTVFCALEMMPEFFAQQHEKITYPYILITHNNDYPAPGAYRAFLDDKKIIAWFTQNMDFTHEKLFPIPIGLANYHWPHGKIEIMEEALKNTYTGDQREGYFAYFNFVVRTNASARQPIWDFFASKPFCRVAQNRSYRDYLQDMKQCKFVISPPGNGLDCHRHWEALYMGCIPIIQHTTIDPLFEDLPVILINEWSEVTQEFLYKKYDELRKKSFKREKLYIDYWFDQIRAIQDNWRRAHS